MEMSENKATLAKRLGCTVHISPLEMKLRRMRAKYLDSSGETIDEWLVDIANSRGIDVVFRPGVITAQFEYPGLKELSNEELVAAVLLLSRVDEPQILRVAAQLISRGELHYASLRVLIERERLERQVKALARQALIVDPCHPMWKRLFEAVSDAPDFSDSLIHWTRLAEPRMITRKVGANGWDLV